MVIFKRYRRSKLSNLSIELNYSFQSEQGNSNLLGDLLISCKPPTSVLQIPHINKVLIVFEASIGIGQLDWTNYDIIYPFCVGNNLRIDISNMNLNSIDDSLFKIKILQNYASLLNKHMRLIRNSTMIHGKNLNDSPSIYRSKIKRVLFVSNQILNNKISKI